MSEERGEMPRKGAAEPRILCKAISRISDSWINPPHSGSPVMWTRLLLKLCLPRLPTWNLDR